VEDFILASLDDVIAFCGFRSKKRNTGRGMSFGELNERDGQFVAASVTQTFKTIRALP